LGLLGFMALLLGPRRCRQLRLRLYPPHTSLEPEVRLVRSPAPQHRRPMATTTTVAALRKITTAARAATDTASAVLSTPIWQQQQQQQQLQATTPLLQLPPVQPIMSRRRRPSPWPLRTWLLWPWLPPRQRPWQGVRGQARGSRKWKTKTSSRGKWSSNENTYKCSDCMQVYVLIADAIASCENVERTWLWRLPVRTSSNPSGGGLPHRIGGKLR